MPNVTYQEKAFLQLLARRLLRLHREAKERGEEYHDLTGYSPLSCGVRAKYHFEEKPGGYMPVAILRKAPIFSEAELEQIAAEMLDGPVKLRATTPDDLEYVRKADAT